MSHLFTKTASSVCLALAISACSPSKTADEYLADAKQYQSQKDFKSALISLKSANAEDPKNALLRFELGNLYLNQGDYLNAEKEIELAQRLGYDDEILLPKLAELKYKLSKYDEVFIIQENASALTDDSYIRVLTFAGLAALYQGDRARAESLIDNANQISSDSIYGQIGEAYLSDSKEDIDKALVNIDSIISIAPDIADSYLLKGYLLQGLKDYKGAAQSFEKYSKLRPKEYQILFFISQNFIQAYEMEDAERTVARLIKLFPEHPLSNQFKAQFELINKNYSLAQQHAITAYQGNNKLTTSAIIAGVSAYYEKQYEKAYSHLIKVEEKIPHGHMVQRLLVELRLRLGYDHLALDDLNKLIETGDADSIMLLAASQELLKVGDKASAQEMLQASMDLNSDDPQILQQQGIMKLRLNDISTSISMLEKSLEADGDSPITEASLAAAYISDNQIEKAMAFAKLWQSQEGKKIKGLLFEASIYQKQAKHDEAKKILRNVLAQEPGNLLAKYKLAVYAHVDKDYDKAFVYYSDIVASNNSHLKAMESLIYLLKAKPELANRLEDFYKTEIAKKSDNNELKFGLANFFSNQNRFDDALSVLKEIKESKNAIKGIDLAIGEVYLAKKDPKTAIESFRLVLASNPAHMVATSKIISSLESQQKLKEALEQVEAGLIHRPTHLGLKLFKAYFQSNMRKMPSSSLISTLQSADATKNHWRLHNTLGNISIISKEYEKGVPHFESAYEIFPNSINAIHLSRALEKAEGIDTAIALLKEHLEKHGSSSSVQAMLANAYINKKDYVLAEYVYLDILKVMPNSVLTLNNLAYINIQKGSAAEALRYASKAVKLSNRSSAVIDTYGQALLMNNKPKEALMQFEKALSITPKNTEALINKSKALYILGNTLEAKKLLDSIKVNNEEEQMLLNDANKLINQDK